MKICQHGPPERAGNNQDEGDDNDLMSPRAGVAWLAGSLAGGKWRVSGWIYL